MTQDEIVEMARQAGAIPIHKKPKDIALVGMENINVFAKLVAAKEREACVQVCEDNATDLSEGDWDSACINCADHIRARGEA